VRAAKKLGWHCIDDLAALGVVVWMGDLFEQPFAKCDELIFGRSEKSEHRKRAPHIVHRRRSAKCRRPLKGYGNTASNDVVGVLTLSEMKLIFEAACQLDRKTLVGPL